jgi:putative transcriptional regulator
MMMKNRVFEQMAKSGIKTRRELALRVGLTESNISRIVSGQVKAIRLDTLESLCKVLDCQPGDLFEYVADGEAA